MSESFDCVLEKVGSRGRFQTHLIYLFIVPLNIGSVFMSNLLLFQTLVPDHWCHVPVPYNNTITNTTFNTTTITTISQLHQWRNITIPRTDTGELSKCLMYEVGWNNITNLPTTISNLTTSCQYGWDHDTSQLKETMATTFEWFCERESYSRHVLALFLAGNAVGAFLLPFVADKYLGRRVMILLIPGLYILFVVPTVFVSQPALHFVLRFLAGLSFPSVVSLPLVMVTEMVRSDHRAWTTGMSYLASALGHWLASLVGYGLPHWKHLVAASCLPFILHLYYYWMVPESPRWLLSKGRLSESCRVLQHIAKINGRGEMSHSQLRQDLLLVAREKKESHFWETFRYRTIRLRLILLFIIGYCFYGTFGILLVGIDVMSSNYFLSNFLLSVVHIPAIVLSWLSMQYLGRRVTILFAALLVGVFSMIATAFTHNEWVLVCLSAFTRLACVLGMQALFVLTPELLPTPVRNTGFGLYCSITCAAMVVSPYIINNTVSPELRYWVMAGLMAVVLAAVGPLPETRGLDLPQTFEEAEHLGTGHPCSAWLHPWRQQKLLPVRNHMKEEDVERLEAE